MHALGTTARGFCPGVDAFYVDALAGFGHSDNRKSRIVIPGVNQGRRRVTPWPTREKLNVTMRLGWSHEFADTARPVTASFTGAPALGFTTFGAQAPRDGVVPGFGANTQVAERTTLYLRYDGDLAGGNTNHVLNAGVRYRWISRDAERPNGHWPPSGGP